VKLENHQRAPAPIIREDFQIVNSSLPATNLNNLFQIEDTRKQ